MLKKFLSLVAVLFICTCGQAQQITRNEVSLLTLEPVTSYLDKSGQISMGGGVFKNAFSFLMGSGGNRDRLVVFANTGKFDVFEGYVGLNDDQYMPSSDVIFSILGDGQTIWTSPHMDKGDAPVRFSIPIKQFSGITLKTHNFTADTQYTPAGTNIYWAEPKFVRFVRVAPPVSSYEPPPSEIQDNMIVSQAVNGRISVFVNNRAVNFGYVQPQSKLGRVLVPMRKIFEALGATVNFDAATGTILANRSGREVQMRVGSNQATVAGQTVNLEVPAQSSFGTTLVPLRFVSEAFNVNVRFQ